MPKHSHRDPDVLGALQKQLREAQKEIRRLHNQHVTTLPVHNKAALPANLQEGEIYIGTDHSLCIRLNGIDYTVVLSAF